MRVIEYSKAATKGQWNDVWDSFDKRQKAKLGQPAANENMDVDIFARAGMAAE